MIQWKLLNVSRKYASIPEKVSEQLKYYVYLYIDPRTGNPFYVGKGKGNRMNSHLKANSLKEFENETQKKIIELKKLKLEPEIEILRYGLTEEQSILVEGTAIDLIGLDNLTNEIRGHYSNINGRMNLKDVIEELNAVPVKISEPVIIISIGKRYLYGMTEIEQYDATRGIWRVSERCHNAKFAFSVFRGIVRQVYMIAGWFSAGSTMTSREDLQDDLSETGRYEFVGSIASEQMRRNYVGKSVREYLPQGSQNPIRYVNC